MPTTNNQTLDILSDDLANICRRIGDPLKQLKNKTVLVAGGGGFLPSYIVDVLVHANETLLDKTCKIIAADNFITGVPERLAILKSKPYFTALQIDISKPFSIDGPLDYVVHGASIASPPTYRKYPLETVHVNVNGTQNLLEMVKNKGSKSFLYLSSSEIYGDPTPEWIPTPENYKGYVSCTGPRACYDESKRLAETLCMIYFHQFQTPVKIVRPFNVYGPRLRLDDGRIVPDLLNNALQSKPLTLYSDGRATRSFCYVADAITAMMLLLLSIHNGEAFNVGNDEEVSIKDVALTVNEIFEGRLDVQFVKSKEADYLTDNPQRRCPNLSKIKKMISWAPQIMLREGLIRSKQWYQQTERGV